MQVSAMVRGNMRTEWIHRPDRRIEVEDEDSENCQHPNRRSSPACVG